MIEIAPNPSGPAHLGTLRTYAVAWRLARDRGCPLFVRFDDNHLAPHAWYSEKWAECFLDELKRLDLSPDGWEYCRQRITSGSVPSWARCREDDQAGSRCFRAFFPPLHTFGRPFTPPEPEKYLAGRPAPVEILPATLDRVLAERHDDGLWHYTEEIVNLVGMQLRGVQATVRALLSANIRLAELSANQWLGIRLPEEALAAVVADDAGALSKSRLKPGDFGTVAWAMEHLGPQDLRRKILESAEQDRRLVIHVSSICSDA